MRLQRLLLIYRRKKKNAQKIGEGSDRQLEGSKHGKKGKKTVNNEMERNLYP